MDVSYLPFASANIVRLDDQLEQIYWQGCTVISDEMKRRELGGDKGLRNLFKIG